MPQSGATIHLSSPLLQSFQLGRWRKVVVRYNAKRISIHLLLRLITINMVKNMLRKRTRERIKKFENEQYKIRFVKKSDVPQKEETVTVKN